MKRHGGVAGHGQGGRGTRHGPARRALGALGAGILLVAASTAGCTPDRDMPEAAEMPDSAEVRRAMESPRARDSMLDTLPGGEMARGDSTAAGRLLEDKMP